MRRSGIALACSFVLGLSGAAVGAAPAHAAGATALVRINQLGYAAAGKRAYLMSSTTETGATFSVLNSSGAVVYTAPVGANLGSWSSAYPDVYALDFDSVTTAGTYTISVSGPVAATSPAFPVGTGQSLYAGAMANALSFYQDERDGANYIPSALRTAPAHLNDEHAMTYQTPSYKASTGAFSGSLTPLGITIDASGGWWDAGDYLKFTETTSYTVDMMLLAVRDYPTETGAGFNAEAKFGLDFLQKMWNDTTQTLYYQVGIGAGNAKTVSDHDIWRLPQADDTYDGCTSLYRYICNRPVFPANTPGGLISPNLAGRVAAAFGLCYQVYRTSDPSYADTCLLSGEHVFALANTAWTGNLTTAIPYSFYPEVEWRDDLELGATELYDALTAATPPAGLPQSNPSYYLQQAATWANAYITGPNDAADTLNLYDVSGVAHYELANAINAAGDPSGLATSVAALTADLKKQLDKAVTQSAADPFGFGFPWDTWDTTSHGAGLVVMAGEYDQLTGTSTYAPYEERWTGNILGANGWGLSFIVGDGKNFPGCLQHQVANLAGSLTGGTPVLAGAAVEGPNSKATTGSVSGMVACPANGTDTYAAFNSSNAEFRDNMQSYSNTEPAIDLTAASVLAFARRMAGQ
ncbi:glycoside hydrolase family 9 protein [Actinospica durhamensis]|uniref:Glycoside hydrolase family 9 protein n=1 Tax=Actinospica durhamensis TaxID=1508375 RepID=A0A941EWH3_9ACTN|nr:glycoside hydrolase family 9 protein [Actinospica durhamensis]MBR7838236.1 glycoside hydrolase family 9 protein [Actinospica durhamensis]